MGNRRPQRLIARPRRFTDRAPSAIPGEPHLRGPCALAGRPPGRENPTCNAKRAVLRNEPIFPTQREPFYETSQIPTPRGTHLLRCHGRLAHTGPRRRPRRAQPEMRFYQTNPSMKQPLSSRRCEECCGRSLRTPPFAVGVGRSAPSQPMPAKRVVPSPAHSPSPRWREIREPERPSREHRAGADAT